MLLAVPDPPTIPCFAPPSAAERLDRTRRGLRTGPDVWEAAVLINHGTYSGKAVHARRDEKQVGNQAGNPIGN